MDNIFSNDNIEKYKVMLKHIGIPPITNDIKLALMEEKLGELTFKLYEKQSKESSNPNTIYLRYARQYGKPFRIKKRILSLGKKYGYSSTTTVNHYAIHFNRCGTIYHFLPDGIHQGKDEYNKEIVNDWENISLNDNVPYFTFLDHQDIINFCKKWSSKIEYNVNNSKIFVCLLSFWLM